MAVPSPPQAAPPWAELTPEEKRLRLLAAAADVLAREGIDAPMPAIAAAAGIGIGSVYRQFASKDDLVAALVIERLDAAYVAACAALQIADPWDGFTGFLHEMVSRQTADDVVNEALARTSDRDDVATMLARCSAEIDRLLARARDAGAIRADAVLEDVFLVFAATRAAEQRLPGGAPRMLALLTDALRA